MPRNDEIQFDSTNDNASIGNIEAFIAHDKIKIDHFQTRDRATGFVPDPKVVQIHHSRPISNNINQRIISSTSNSTIRAQDIQARKLKNQLMNKINKIMGKEKQIIELKKIRVRYQVDNISKTETSLPFRTANKSQKEIKRSLSIDKQLLPYGQQS